MQALEDSIDIDAIVFGGCSIFACIYLGALAALDDLNLLHRIRRVAGVSSGAAVALMFACVGPAGIFRPATAQTVLNVGHHVLSDQMPLCCSTLVAAWRIYSMAGLVDVQAVVGVIQKVCMQGLYDRGLSVACDNDLTFERLHQLTGVSVVIFATQVPTAKSTRFCRISTPDISVFDALRASMSIEFVFTPVLIENAMYLDGGISNNFPLSAFDEEDGTVSTTTLGLLVLPNGYNGSMGEVQRRLRKYMCCPQTVAGIVETLYNSMHNQVQFSASEKQMISARRTIIYDMTELGSAGVDVDEAKVLDHALSLYAQTIKALRGTGLTRDEVDKARSAIWASLMPTPSSANTEHAVKMYACVGRLDM